MDRRTDGDKLRRANAWSPFVENGVVLFGPGQKELVNALLAVPMDRTKWDLVDAAGLAIRGLPVLQGESQPILGIEGSTPKRAISYAARVSRPPEGQPLSMPPSVRSILPAMPDPGMKRAAGYAVRIGRVKVK